MAATSMFVLFNENELDLVNKKQFDNATELAQNLSYKLRCAIFLKNGK
jgi:hypothetical protein